jgi:hypothetical protein
LRNSVCASLRPSPVIAQSAGRERLIQTNQFGHDFRAGLERAAQQLQRETQAAGRARAGRFGCLAADRSLGARGETRD